MMDSTALSCPECGSDLPVEQQHGGSCEGCGRSYVNWFGNLIPDQTTPSVKVTE